MLEENKAIVRKIYEVIATGDFDRAEEIVDPEAADNERPSHLGLPHPKLLDTFKRFAAEVRTAFTDVHTTVEDMIAEGDKVAARVTMRGTHQGEFEGIAPTGKRVKVSTIDIFRFADGKIVEHWGQGDDPTAVLCPPEPS